MFLNSTLENGDLVGEEDRQLDLLLNESLHIITLVSAECTRLQTSTQLEAENQHKRSILFSNKLSFLWRFCNKSTAVFTLPACWAVHTSRRFFLSQETKVGRCLQEVSQHGGDLAVVLSAEVFLTNLTFSLYQKPASFFNGFV